MKNLVKDIITLNINEIDSYNFPLNKVFGLEIINDGIKFCFIIKFSDTNKNLICCAPVAHQRNSKTSDGKLITPPYFDRWSWYKYFDESFIAFADPIFFYDENITVGWFVGDKNQWYLETVAKIITKLSKKQNIFPNNILFYSSSGGGFASVGLGTLIKGSKVIIDNSQLFIMNFHEGDKKNLFNTLYKEFPGCSKSEIIDKINYRLDVIELFKKYEYIPPIHCYVNLESDEDLYDQCIPFIEEIKNLKFYSNNLTVFLYKDEKEKPHAPMPSETTINIIKSFSNCYLYNAKEDNTNVLINNLNNNNNSLNNQILELKNKVKFLNDSITCNDTNTNKDYIHRLKKQNLERKEQQLQKKEEKLELKEQKLKQTENIMNEKEKELIKRDALLKEQEKSMTLKNKQIHEKEKKINEILIDLERNQKPNEKNISSKSYGRWELLAYDYATSTDYNNESFVKPRGNIERTNDGTILTGNWGDIFFSPNKNEFCYGSPIILELTVVDIKDSSHIRFQLYSEKQNLNITYVLSEFDIKNNNNVKIIYDGNELDLFIEDSLKSKKKVSFVENFRIGIQTFSSNASFKYKDVKVYKFD